LVQLKRVFVAVLCVLGFGVGASVPAAASTGGAMASEPTPTAVITEVACVARCDSLDAVAPGALLRLRGTTMKSISKVAFLGARGAADDVIAPALRARVKSVDVLVPEQAVSGPLLAINRDGGQSAASRAAVSVRRAAGSDSALDVRIVGSRVFVGAARPARVDLLPRQAMSVAVALVRLADGAIVQGWPLGTLVPGVVRTVTWDGMVAGVAQPVGRYEFRVFSQATGAQAAQTPAPLALGSFDLVDHKFPVRGKHTYGTGIAAFGAGRNGHSHQGHDVFAACGTPLVAARGGVVKLNQNEANAGNYLVIDGAGTDVDYVYMHLAAPSPLKKGAIVMTGQAIGEVGDTGDAVGCHLHFEMWTAPGWYTGGAPVDPLPALKAWDAYS
jgi:murein DD-endopeptidase MepM/ murein hydrolase activator NlpD